MESILFGFTRDTETENILSWVVLCRPGIEIRVMVPYTEIALRDRLKAAGGRWISEEHLRRMPFGLIHGDAELEERILQD